MVGAGVLYFQRSDDPNGWHHLGNVDEFTINNNIETVEKNSSMNKKRELMASVVTSVSPTGSLTMTEYNPFDLALGLFGREGVYNQTGRTVNSEAYVVPSVPGIITVMNSDGNRSMDISNVVLRPQSAVPVSAIFDYLSATQYGSASGSVFTDSNGGKITVNVGSANPTDSLDIYIAVDVPNDSSDVVAGDLINHTLYAQVGIGANAVQVTETISTSHTTAFSWTNPAFGGVEIVIDPTTGGFSDMSTTVFPNGLKFTVEPGMDTYKEGRDYVLDEQELRAGIIKIKAGGLINANDTVLVSCNVPAKKFVTVSGADAGEISGKLLFVGDPNIGGRYNIEAWSVKVTPDGDLSGLISSNDFGSYTLQLRFLSDYENHPEYPYYKATLIGRSSGDSAVSGVYDPEY